MIKITVVTNSDKTDVIKPGNTTPRDIFDELDVQYGMCTINLNGRKLTNADLDHTLEELGATTGSFLSAVVKADNAVEVKIEGSAVILTSTMKLEDMKLAEKYRPESLKVYEGEGKDRKLKFVVCTGDGAGEISCDGIMFGETPNAEGFANVAVIMEGCEDIPHEVEERWGSALLNIEKVEAALAAVVENIHNEQAQIRSKITVA